MANQVGYKHSEITLQGQSQEDLNACLLLEDSQACDFWSSLYKDGGLFRTKQFQTGTKKKEVKNVVANKQQFLSQSGVMAENFHHSIQI